MSKSKIKTKILEHKSVFKEVIRKIYDYKELGDKEFESSKLLTKVLKDFGYEVRLGYSGLETAFLASKKGKEKKGVIAILAEYDALPKIGHGCGHNLIAAMTVGSAIGLSEVISELPIEVRIIGTPAEETTAGKIKMVENNVFDDVDCVLMCHPYTDTGVRLSGLAIQGIEYKFIGKSSHAANAPHEGKNALQAMINFFNNINSLRLYLPKTSSVHGIITYGGEAPNIIPDLSISKFNIRDINVSKLNELVDMVEDAAKSAAISTQTKYEVYKYLKPIYDIKTNNVLATMLESNLKELGFDNILQESINLGSSDIGNVSYRTPTVHAMVKVAENNIPLHTVEFAENTLTEYAMNNSIKASIAMAYTVFDISNSLALIREMKEELNNSLHADD